MVYCGKASQGCQSCRTRRIKCDKLRPDCSQCVRVGKKCPGYRDQLSLMFRDESSKVIQKAHAQWGVGDSPDASASGLSETNFAHVPEPGMSLSQKSPASTLPSPPSSQVGFPTDVVSYSNPALLSPIGDSLEDQGYRFYVDRYLLGHPDEPRNTKELHSYDWNGDPALRDICTAVGLAGLSNLKGESDMMAVARRRYGEALRTAGQLIQTRQTPSIDVASRLVVLLALFEMVKGTELSAGTVYAHVAGGSALIRSWYPMRKVPCGGVRPLIQLCYSTFITTYETGMHLPSMFYDWVEFARQTTSPEDAPATDLGLLIGRFVELSSSVRFKSPSLGKDCHKVALDRLLEIENELAAWEKPLDGQWHYKTENAGHLPAAAVFEGEYHVYHDMWIASLWNHYRWARLLVNQMIIELANKRPVLMELTTPKETHHDAHLQTIRRLCREIFISIPNHWRHPLLRDRTSIPVEQKGIGGAGAGAAGLPVLLFQLKAAICAPGTSRKEFDWAYGIVESIWGDMGMVSAKAIMDDLMAHRDRL